MTYWFGEPWPDPDLRAPICEDDNFRVPTPVGMPCSWCQEPIDEASQGVMHVFMVSPTEAEVMPCHTECNLRQVIGGPGHILGVCSCTGGEADCDPDLGMAPREAAVLSWQLLQRLDGSQ